MNPDPLFFPYGIDEGCYDCAKQGYCKVYFRWLSLAKKTEAFLLKYKDGRAFADYVPVTVLSESRGDFSRLHMQNGCDAFHQDDFETALFHFKTVTETVCSDAEAQLCVAICLFSMGQYLESIEALNKCPHFRYETAPPTLFLLAFEHIAAWKAGEVSDIQVEHLEPEFCEVIELN